jgi:hypothetical protein
MNTGELACKTLDRMAELMDKREKIIELKICQGLTGEIYNQKFIDLLRELRGLNLVEKCTFQKKGIAWDSIRLSKKGIEMASRIKDDDMRKYFIVAITIYCDQKKFTPNELCELLSKTDSFKSKDEVEEIIKNFRKMFVIEENYVKIGKDWKRTTRVKDCVFNTILIMEETK